MVDEPECGKERLVFYRPSPNERSNFENEAFSDPSQWDKTSSEPGWSIESGELSRKRLLPWECWAVGCRVNGESEVAMEILIKRLPESFRRYEFRYIEESNARRIGPTDYSRLENELDGPFNTYGFRGIDDEEGIRGQVEWLLPAIRTALAATNIVASRFPAADHTNDSVKAQGITSADASSGHSTGTVVANSSDSANDQPLEPVNNSVPDTPMGFLGGKELVNALGIHASRTNAFFQALGRNRKLLGDDCWHEVREPRPNCPRFLYRVNSPQLCDFAAAYKEPKPA